MRIRNKRNILPAVLLITMAATGCMPGTNPPRTQQAPNAPAVPTQPIPDNRMGASDTVTRQPAPDGRMQAPNAATPMREAQNIANALVGKQHISRANVFVTDRTAYVAVNIPNVAQSGLTEQIKQEVAKEVRRVDPSIEHVYVSADPDVFDRFQGFSNDIQAGRPIQGIYERFSEMVQRVFPQKR